MELSATGSVDVTEYNSLKLTSTARAIRFIDSIEALDNAIDEAFALDMEIAVLGEGTNSVFPAHIDGMILKCDIAGLEFVQSGETSVRATVGAGLNWDDFVRQCVDQGLWGVENLALIPGSVGAAPVQNIGAYGVEVSSVIQSVVVFDIHSRTVKEIPAEQCEFGYRESRFKRDWRGKFFIIQVVFELSTVASPVLNYAGLDALQGDSDLTSKRIADEVSEIRSQKLPQPSVLPNAGSYFKNPIVPSEHAERLVSDYPSVPHWVMPEGVKFAAGWLIERCGLKGEPLEGGITPYAKQALVLTNPKGACYDQLIASERWIIAEVSSKFGVELEREPQLITPFAILNGQ